MNAVSYPAENENTIHKLTLFVKKSEGIHVQPFNRISINNNVHATLKDIAIYTNAKFMQPIEGEGVVDDQGNPVELIYPPAIMFANDLYNPTPNSLTFRNIAISSNITHCPENTRCAQPAKYRFITNPSPNLQTANLYYYQRHEEIMEPEIPNLAPIYDTVSLNDAMANLNDVDWQRKTVTEDGATITIPWLKR